MKPFLIGLTVVLFVQDAPQDEKVQELIRQLDSESLVQREEAMDALVEMGPDILKSMKAAADSENAEIASRAAAVVRKIETMLKIKKVYPEPKSITFDRKDVPLTEVLDDLRKQSGLQIDADAVNGSQVVSLALTRGTPFEAFDGICRQLKDVVWTNDSKGVIVFKKGAFVDTPADYHEHFRIHLTEVEFSRKTDFKENSGTVTLYVDLKHRAAVETSFAPIIQVDKVVDDTGSELKDALSGAQMNQKFAIMRAMGQMGGGAGQMFQFEGTGKGAKSLKTIRGTVKISFPLEKAEISFTEIKLGATQTAGQFEVTIGRINRSYVQVTIKSKGGAVDFSQIVDPTSVKTFDKDGKELTTDARIGAAMGMAIRPNSGGNQNSYSFYVYTRGAKQPAASMKLKIIKEIHTKEIPFEIKNLDLP